MAGTVIKPLHTGISVKNMEESVKWYEEFLGFRLVQDLGFVPPLKAHLAFIEHPSSGYQIELFEYEQPIPIPQDRLLPNTDLMTCGTKHLAVAVDDMDAFKEKFLAGGGDIAHEVSMGADKVMFIRDPSGTLVELIQQPK